MRHLTTLLHLLCLAFAGPTLAQGGPILLTGILCDTEAQIMEIFEAHRDGQGAAAIVYQDWHNVANERGEVSCDWFTRDRAMLVQLVRPVGEVPDVLWPDEGRAPAVLVEVRYGRGWGRTGFVAIDARVMEPPGTVL